MKKFLKVIICFFIVLTSSFSALADETETEKKRETVFDGGGLQGGVETLEKEAVGTGIETEFSFTEMVLYWVKVLLTILGTIAFVAFIWAGFLYITAFAREDNVEQAKNAMIYAAIGIIIILISYVAVDFLINMGADTCNPANGNADCASDQDCSPEGYCIPK